MITNRQYHEPLPETIGDCFDRPIDIGDHVCYNLSGDLTTGVVERVVVKFRSYSTLPERYHFDGFIIIKQDRTGKLSKVKNNRGVYILKKGNE